MYSSTGEIQLQSTATFAVIFLLMETLCQDRIYHWADIPTKKEASRDPFVTVKPNPHLEDASIH